MTKLEALQSQVEYSNTNLFAKVLIDKGIDGTATYSVANVKEIDLALAEVLGVMVGLPDFKEGSHHVKYSVSQLIAWRKTILKKYNKASGYSVNGRARR